MSDLVGNPNYYFYHAKGHLCFVCLILVPWVFRMLNYMLNYMFDTCALAFSNAKLYAKLYV